VFTKFSRPTNITAAHLSQTTSTHFSKFRTFHHNMEVEMAVHDWLRMLGENCKVVLWWPKCIHVSGDVLGMNGLQLTTSILERSDLPGHDEASVCQTVRYVGQQSLHVQGTRCPNNLHEVMYPKPKFSLSKYTMKWPPVRVQLFSSYCSEHPGYSHCALGKSRTHQAVSRSHK